jgi:beta-glucosidase
MTALYRFPQGFLWGAATASHQVEGGNRWNDWWEFETTGRLPHQSGEACRHFELYESDFDLAGSFGHNAHRLSIEWSRIEPRAGHIDTAALDHYVRVIEALRARGLEPLVTLHHFTNPAWFAHAGGWERSGSIGRFARYAQLVVKRLAGLVRYWVTLNEPTVFVIRAYVKGDWPPLRPASWWTAGRVLRNMARAHAVAFDLIHAHRPDAMVGLAHSAPYIVPANPRRTLDRFAARTRNLLFNDLLFDFVPGRAASVMDFIGINYYVRQSVRWRPRGLAALLGKEEKQQGTEVERRFSTLGWEIYPEGLYGILHRFASYGLPLIVTENGLSTGDEAARSEFITAHVQAVARALRSGVDVRGYFYWSLMDNFEWAEGRAARFGLAAVQPDQQRVERPAARVLERICRANAVSES